jgi:hypothetical protein
MPDEPAKISAFISYASADKAKADEVCASLESHGYTCWIAPRNIRAGHDYADEIVKGIHGSKCLVLILSAAANESPFVHREVERAVSANKMIFPLRIQEVLPSPALELFVSSAHWIDAWKGKLDDHIEHLARGLSEDDSSPKAQAPPPQPLQKKSPVLLIGIAAVVVLGLVIFIVSKFIGNSPPTTPAPALVAPPHPVASIPPAAQPAPKPPPPPPPLPKPPGAIQLTLTAMPAGQQPMTAYEVYQPSPGKLVYTFLCPPNTAAIRASYDGQGYFETPAQVSPRAYPTTLQDWPAGSDLRLIFESTDGSETGPFVFAHQDREAIILAALKTDFLRRAQLSVDSYLIPFNLPFTDDPKQQLADAQAATDPTQKQQLITIYRTTLQKQNVVKGQLNAVQCSFVTSAPTVACLPAGRIPLVDWAAVKEVHLSAVTGQSQLVVPVNIDWSQFLKDGNQYYQQNPNLLRGRFNIWNSVLPPDTTDVYATFIFQDSTPSDEMRFRVDTTRLK